MLVYRVGWLKVLGGQMGWGSAVRVYWIYSESKTLLLVLFRSAILLSSRQVLNRRNLVTLFIGLGKVFQKKSRDKYPGNGFQNGLREGGGFRSAYIMSDRVCKNLNIKFMRVAVDCLMLFTE